MSERLAVNVMPDGPVEIKNATSVRFCGKELKASGDLLLCRCGESTNAPFCDWTHASVGFDGGCENPPDKELRVWEGATLRTFFNANACMHVFYCKPLKELRARELEGDTEAAAEIMRVVGTCPSGALSYERKADIAEPAHPARPVDVDIVEGGEIRLQAEFEINAPLLERQASDTATLCRCGLSKNKPWCDGRHMGKKGFR